MRQVIGAAARVSFEVGEALFLALQRGQQGKQGDVLVDVGEVARMETVAILHRALRVVELLFTARAACRWLGSWFGGWRPCAARGGAACGGRRLGGCGGFASRGCPAACGRLG